MKQYASILPGARVRSDDGFIGTVERLEHHWTDQSDQPDRMIVRSEDRHWRYSIPLMFVSSVTQRAFHPIVHISVHADELAHYVLGPADEAPLYDQPTTVLPQDQSPADAAQPADGASDVVLRMPIHEERLVVHKQPIVLGKVHIHKGVETEEQRIPVPVYHEEAIVEHISPDQYDGLALSNPNETIIPIIEERLVVKKESVVKEYLRVRKHLVPEQQEVRDSIRREVVQISEERQDGVDPAITLLRDGTSASAEDASSGQERQSGSPG